MTLLDDAFVAPLLPHRPKTPIRELMDALPL